MTAATAYPLCWPEHFPRTKYRERGAFKTTLSAALKNVEGALRRFGVDSGKPVKSVVLSSNATLGAFNPADPGIAVWFTWDDQQVCIPVDRYQTVEANLQAVFHIIEARRVELRHGTLALVRATMTGFKAIPAPGAKPWWEVLDVQPTARRDEIEAQYRNLARQRHPDVGGSEAMMAELNAARDRALKEV